MESFIDNFGKILALVSVIAGVVFKIYSSMEANQKLIYEALAKNQARADQNTTRTLKEQMETNHQLEKLNMTMEHQLEVMKNDIDNNFILVDDNFAIINDEVVKIKRVVFDKDYVNDLPIRDIKHK